MVRRLHKALLTAAALALVAVAAQAAQVTFAWDPNTEPDLAGYRIYCGNATGNYAESRDVGNVTTYTWDGLVPGMTYFCAATAYDTEGLESNFSNEVSYTPPTAGSPPAKPEKGRFYNEKFDLWSDGIGP